MSRIITGTILKPDGTPWVGGIIKFQLVETFVTSTTVYPKHIHQETLDSNGQFIIDLGVPDAGTVLYRITPPDGIVYDVAIGSGVPTNLQTLITVATTAAAQDALQTLIDANNVLKRTNVDSTYVILSTDDVVRCDGTFTVTLPAAIDSGKGYCVINVGTGVITLAADGSDLIFGQATQTIYSMETYVVLDAAIGKWDIVGG